MTEKELDDLASKIATDTLELVMKRISPNGQTFQGDAGHAAIDALKEVSSIIERCMNDPKMIARMQ